jgi:hypothetical protein
VGWLSGSKPFSCTICVWLQCGDSYLGNSGSKPTSLELRNIHWDMSFGWVVDIRIYHKFLLLVITSVFSCVCDVICLTYFPDVQSMESEFCEQKRSMWRRWLRPVPTNHVSFCISLSIATHGKYMRVCLCHGPQSNFLACPLAHIMIGSILKTDYFMQNCFKNVVIIFMRN